MNRIIEALPLLFLSFLLSGRLSAQESDLFLPGNLSGGTVISSVPFDTQGGMQGGIPIGSDPYTAQGMPLSGNGSSVVPNGDINSLSGTVIPYDSPLLQGGDFNSAKPYGPSNPPPVINFVKRNRRDNGLVKPQELPENSRLLDSLARQVRIWSPETVHIETVSPDTVIKMTIPFGIDTQFLCRTNRQSTAPKSGQILPASEPAYAVGILCWNIPIGKKRIFNPASGLVIPRIGYGYQQTRGELLASLAMANVASSYEIRSSANTSLTVNDLMETEMREMTFHEDLSMLAVGLSFYLTSIDRTWTDAEGNDVTLLSLAEYELNRPVYWNRSESINRLVGLTFLSNRFRREMKAGNSDPKLQELTSKIDTYLQTVHRRTLTGLNEAGIRETRFLSAEKIRSASDVLLVNGHILRWQLIISDRHPINSQSLRKSIYHLALTLAQFYDPRTDKLETLSPKEVEAVSVSLHAVKLYVKKYSKEEDTTEAQDTDSAAK